jgi:hypothetical protein
MREHGTDDLINALRSADPIRRTDLGRIDPAALTALRDAVPTAEGRPTVRPVRRWVGRAAAVGGTLAVLVGGGAAYAGYHDWYNSSGGADGITCSLDYGPMGTTGDLTSGGPSLTGDPIADCARYQEEAGLPPIEDPVAFRDPGYFPVVVTPRDLVPEGAELLGTATAEDLAVQALEASVYDLVDGPNSVCPDPTAAVVLAQGELDRLALADWTVVTEPTVGTAECASVGVDAEAQVLRVQAGGMDTLETFVARGDMGAEALTLREALRAGIADTCVDLGTAEAVVVQALGSQHHWPTSAVEDPTAECTRVDMLVGGSIQVTLHGPR